MASSIRVSRIYFFFISPLQDLPSADSIPKRLIFNVNKIKIITTDSLLCHGHGSRQSVCLCDVQNENRIRHSVGFGCCCRLHSPFNCIENVFIECIRHCERNLLFALRLDFGGQNVYSVCRYVHLEIATVWKCADGKRHRTICQARTINHTHTYAYAHVHADKPSDYSLSTNESPLRSNIHVCRL